MEQVLAKLQEAVEIKNSIAKQEALLWQKLSEALTSYLHSQGLGEQRRGIPFSNKAVPTHMNTKKAAKYLGIGYNTMHQWRTSGRGPKFIKIGRYIRYRITDLEDFLSQNASYSSSYEKK